MSLQLIAKKSRGSFTLAWGPSTTLDIMRVCHVGGRFVVMSITRLSQSRTSNLQLSFTNQRSPRPSTVFRNGQSAVWLTKGLCCSLKRGLLSWFFWGPAGHGCNWYASLQPEVCHYCKLHLAEQPMKHLTATWVETRIGVTPIWLVPQELRLQILSHL